MWPGLARILAQNEVSKSLKSAPKSPSRHEMPGKDGCPCGDAEVTKAATDVSLFLVFVFLPAVEVGQQCDQGEEQAQPAERAQQLARAWPCGREISRSHSCSGDGFQPTGMAPAAPQWMVSPLRSLQVGAASAGVALTSKTRIRTFARMTAN